MSDEYNEQYRRIVAVRSIIQALREGEQDIHTQGLLDAAALLIEATIDDIDNP
jgi:hypothetical protein